MSKEQVTLEEVRRVAELAQLELTAQEEDRMLQDLNGILAHVARLGELDTSQVAPLAQVSELGVEPAHDTLRIDEARPSLDHDRVLSAAPLADALYFKVPKVIER